MASLATRPISWLGTKSFVGTSSAARPAVEQESVQEDGWNAPLRMFELADRRPALGGTSAARRPPRLAAHAKAPMHFMTASNRYHISTGSTIHTTFESVRVYEKFHGLWGAFDSAKNHQRQRRKRQSVTAKREKSQTPKFV